MTCTAQSDLLRSVPYIEAVPNRNSPPAILLRESYRHEGKVRKRTLCNLSDWPAAHIEGLRGVLKGGTVIPPEHDAFIVTRSLPHGHVAAALGTARKIGLASMQTCGVCSGLGRFSAHRAEMSW